MQHNLTVMDFNENYGMIDPLLLKLFSFHEICPNYFTPSISLKKPGRLSQPSLSHDAGALLAKSGASLPKDCNHEETSTLRYTFYTLQTEKRKKNFDP